MYFSETPSLWVFKTVMQIISSFAPRGCGAVIFCEYDFTEENCIDASQKEILTRTMS